MIAEHDDFAEALKAVLDAAFDLTEHEVLRNRVLVAEQSLVGLHRTSAREEEARQLARSRMRDLEFAWATFLTRGMEQGAIPRPTRACSPAPARPLQQRLALVPPARRPLARRGREFFVAAASRSPASRRPAKRASQAQARQARG